MREFKFPAAPADLRRVRSADGNLLEKQPDGRWRHTETGEHYSWEGLAVLFPAPLTEVDETPLEASVRRLRALQGDVQRGNRPVPFDGWDDVLAVLENI